MKEKIKKMPGRIRNYFCSHMSAQVTVTVVLLLILAGLVLQIYVKNQYFNYLLRNTRSMEESMIETSTINIDANLKDIISAACNVGVNRIEQAQYMLREEICDQRDVPYQVGFSDSKYFKKVFREVTGKSPSEYLSEIKE